MCYFILTAHLSSDQPHFKCSLAPCIESTALDKLLTDIRISGGLVKQIAGLRPMSCCFSPVWGGPSILHFRGGACAAGLRTTLGDLILGCTCVVLGTWRVGSEGRKRGIRKMLLQEDTLDWRVSLCCIIQNFWGQKMKAFLIRILISPRLIWSLIYKGKTKKAY